MASISCRPVRPYHKADYNQLTDMKHILLFSLLLTLGVTAAAQNPFACTTQGVKLRYMNVDGEGHEVSVSEMEVTQVEASGDSLCMTQVTTMYMNGKRFMKPIETKAVIRDGDVMMDMSGSMTATVEGSAYSLPKRLAVGLELPVGESEAKVGSMEVKQNTTFHKVVAREEVEVPAGTFDCYVVERQFTAEVMGMTTKGATKTWYARGIGTVKSENYYENGSMQSGAVLIELNLPE